MDDLLKEAIADAKAVRETALENAKIALEEAFTPRLQSMLAKKIQSEIEEEEGEDWEDEEEEEAPAEEGEYHEDDEDPSDEDSEEMPADMDMEEDEEEIEDDEEEMDMEGVIEINGVKYAPVVSEEEEEAEEEAEEEPEMEESDDLDLEAVLRQLEEDESVDEEVDESKEEEVDESKEEEVDESKEEVDESKEEEVDESKEEVDESKEEEVDESKEEVEEATETEEVDEDIDLEEVIAALSEEENEEEATNEVAKLQSDLDEHRNVVKYLRTKLNEVNLLNAKLLFTNKLFRSFGLTNDQKMKVVENFDRAHNLREVKLVYSTLAESFGSKPKTEIKESKGSASKAVASTKSEKQEVIAEGHEMRDRFKKLAGIL